MAQAAYAEAELSSRVQAACKLIDRAAWGGSLAFAGTPDGGCDVWHRFAVGHHPPGLGQRCHLAVVVIFARTVRRDVTAATYFSSCDGTLGSAQVGVGNSVTASCAL